MLEKEVPTEDEVKTMWKPQKTSTKHFIDDINTYIKKLNEKPLWKKIFGVAGGGHLEQLRADILNHEMETGQRDLEARRHFNALLRARRARD